MTRQFFTTPALFLLTLAAGCNSLGSNSIREERPNYNDAIHDTSKQQLFVNLIRVHDHDSTLFMDVTEVDAQLQFQGQFTTAFQGIGTPNHMGQVGAGATYQESPTIRYQPLTGQALVAQISTPITVDSLAELFDSDWPIGPVLDMAVDRLTPDYEDYYSALNAIMELDDYGALVVTAGKSDLSATTQPTPNDSLILYLEPSHVDPYPDADSDAGPTTRQTQEQAQIQITRLWDRLLHCYQSSLTPDHRQLLADFEKLNGADAFQYLNTHPFLRRLEIRTSPYLRRPVDVDDLAPMMRTRSALGIIREATSPGGFVAFITPQRYAEIQKMPWNTRPLKVERHFYITSPANPAPDETWLESWFNATRSLNTRFDQTDENVEQESDRRMERTLGQRRRYVLIIQSPSYPPDDAFVTAFSHNIWYYVDGTDDVSKKNLMLIGQFLQMQAIPNPGGQIIPTLSISH